MRLRLIVAIALLICGGIVGIILASSTAPAVAAASGPYGAVNPVPLAAVTVAQTAASNSSLEGYILFNPNTSPCVVEFFPGPASGVTLGTTAPSLYVPLPAGGMANLDGANSLEYFSAGSFSIAAVTSPDGSATCTDAVEGTLLVQ